MNEILLTAACLFFFLGAAFCSGTEMGLYCVNRLRARLQAEQEPTLRNRALWWVLRHPEDAVVSVLLGNNLVNYLLTVSAAAFAVVVLDLSPDRAEYYMAAVLSPLVFVFGDVVPKNWFRVDSDRLMRTSSPLLAALQAFFRFSGILFLLRLLSRTVGRIMGQGPLKGLDSPRAEVVGLLREGGAEGAITDDQAQIIERVMTLSDVTVGSIMIPLRQVVTVPVDADRAALEQLIEASRHSRLPVVAGSQRGFVGVVDIHDVLAEEGDYPVQRCMRPPLRIPANESAASALVQIQRTEAALAVVTDTGHGDVGILTLKDVMDEIFGELPEW